MQIPIYPIIIMFSVIIERYLLTLALYPSAARGLRGRDRMVVRFTTTYAISAYHH
jgi:hypothetical protein